MYSLTNAYAVQFSDGSYLKENIYQGFVYDNNLALQYNKTNDINEAAMFSAEASADVAIDMLNINEDFYLVEIEFS